MAVDPQILQFYQRLAEQFGALPPPADALAQRARFEAIAKVSERPDPEGIEVSDLTLPLPGRTLDAVMFRPQGVLRPRLLVWFHGGGWVVGSGRTTHRLLGALLAADTGCAVISVDYRLAPEHPFPAPADDARDALAHLAEQRLRLSLDPDFLAVGGDSAGGHLAAQAAQAVHDTVRPGLVTAQLLVYPVTTPAFGSESYNAFAQGPGLTRDEMRWYWTQFIGEAARDRPLAEQDARLFLMAHPPGHTPPDTVVIVAAHDVLRDDGLAYADYLVQHGAQVVTIEASGMTHAFARLQPEAERAREWMRRAAHAFVGMIGEAAG
ncbi:alpha/beta hydrolase [Ralstonia solanacearum]|uniref:Alpha/beta hydrolase n=1 Tax=Ralstonia solanacearum TaxID=305 RepID=A0AAD0WEU0_RALSL|nr:alpha/beta hydrolase [Ralstonia solanacearum]AXV80179.1 alpha/beta hydrolase [Ralstonia solanacearum]AXW51322.1 alpha/beta hydrolase [Ralstonia solanacearum]